MGLAHWAEVPEHRAAVGEMDAVWQQLGAAAGTVEVGLNRVRVAPGKLPTPPHSHSASEEIYYVLAGSGLAWQDGDVHELRAHDCVIHTADHFEHTFVAGDDGLEFLVFGTRHPTELAWLPRSRAIRTSWPWVEGRDDNPWDVEATVPPLEVGEPKPRPENILNIDEVELVPYGGSIETAPLATPERSRLAGFHWERILPGKTGSVPHCHSEEEEIFVILEGTATLHLWPSPLKADRGAEREEHELQPGHVVARPAGSGVSHWFRAGDEGCVMLIYGTRRANDMCFYPRSNKISFRGLGVIGRVEHLDYWDGETRD
ncbi:MAG TPA: cupin domain-containing protein [Gaiellaceae bacterium]|nr:cupin domain-containing protein [Gaiellaceae bacterium]